MKQKTRIVTVKEAHTWFGHLIMRVSLRRQTPTLPAADLYQELLLAVSERTWAQMTTKCRETQNILPVNPAHVTRFVNHKVIDLLRSDIVYRKHLKQENFLEPTVMSPQDSDYHSLINLLKSKLTKKEFEILQCRVLEPVVLHNLAVRDHRIAVRARGLGKLKMNVSAPKIQNKHVAELFDVSGATISRVFTKARKVVSKAREELTSV